jgi:hypothetical protein
VEVNMAAAEKQTSCDVTIHTDFGMVWDVSHMGACGEWHSSVPCRPGCIWVLVSLLFSHSGGSTNLMG